MCGRFYLDADLDEILRRFNVRQIGSVQVQTGDIYPTQQIPVILEQQERQLVTMRWGWEASFLKKPLINARAETLLEKNFFRQAIQTRRCIVPASGYYEWAMTSEGKRRYGITVKDQPLIALAGIYQVQALDSGEQIRVVTLITRPAAAEIRGIHDRMPMILENQALEEFLSAHLTEKDLRNLLSFKYPIGEMKANRKSEDPHAARTP